MGNHSSLIFVILIAFVITVFVYTIVKAASIRSREMTEVSKTIPTVKQRKK